MKKLLIAGGDMRQIYCGKKLAGNFDVAVTGFDTEYLPDSVRIADKNEKFDFIVLPVVAEDEKGNLNTPCGSDIITINKLSEYTDENSIVFHGKISSNAKALFRNTADYLSVEEFCLRNAVPTAEGAVQTALEELPVTLNGTKVLIVGMGRIGSALIPILKGFGADVTVSVRNSKGSAKAYVSGVKSVCTDKMDTDYRLVFNTVPSLIFNRELLSKFSGDTLFIDLASKPGGIDFKSASELGKHVIWALGLPGKTSPVTAGEIIADTISGMISERGELH